MTQQTSTFSDWKQQLKTEPKTSLAATPQIYDQVVRADQPDAFAAKLAGGPMGGVVWPIYNAIGEQYPTYDRETKDAALHGLLRVFDMLNKAEVDGSRGDGHTTGIREPLLLSDIGIVAFRYWPGMDEGKYAAKKFKTFSELEKEIMIGGKFDPTKVRSDFLVGYALLRSDMSKFSESYASAAEPAFLERVLRGIVGLRFGGHLAEPAEGMARLRKLLPKSTHERIGQYYSERDWADHRKFTR